MTPTEIENINRDFATEVMRFYTVGKSTRWWMCIKGRDELTNFSFVPGNPDYWDPYHRWDHAWMGLEKFHEGSNIEIGNAYYNDNDWWCEIDGAYLGVADTAPAAICLACIEAKKEK